MSRCPSILIAGLYTHTHTGKLFASVCVTCAYASAREFACRELRIENVQKGNKHTHTQKTHRNSIMYIVYYI